MKSIRLLPEQLKSCAQVFLAVLREIFDEAAYDRFLERNQLASSTASYAAFCRERESGQAPKPRCC